MLNRIYLFIDSSSIAFISVSDCSMSPSLKGCGGGVQTVHETEVKNLNLNRDEKYSMGM